jgi:uncharacterized membrane protein
MGWGKKFKSVVSSVSAVVDPVVSVVQEIKDVSGNVIAAANDAVQSVNSNVISPLLEVRDDIEAAYNNSTLKDYIQAAKPLYDQLDQSLREIPIVGEIYSSGREFQETTKAQWQTYKAWWDVYKGKIPEEAAVFVDNVEQAIGNLFYFLGWD